ncbi:ERF family protein [Solibacillus isronensis]|uniref:ERF family protein n=1 Tax=Solibacillus isronensis TaxID=412383 RepID=UPI0039A3ECED
MNKSETIIELAKAMATFQSEVKQPTKDGKNPHFRSTYVTLDGVVSAITETASKHGLSFMQFPINQENKVGVKTLVMHTSGEFIESEPVFATPMKQDPQAAGSVLTYLRRYSLSAVFGITSDEDDDGNHATFGNSKPAAQQGSKTVSNGITTAQINSIKAKTGNIAKAQGIDQAQVYKSAATHFKIDKRTNELTQPEASKIIEYLATLE